MYVQKAEFLNPMTPSVFRAQRVRKETVDTFTLELAAAAGHGPFQFAPGQFNMLYVYGAGEVPISISGNPATPETLVHTTRAVGVVTKAMEKLAPGSLMGVRGPFGKGWPIDKARGCDVVIVAGGIGLAPLRPALYTVMANRAAYGRVVLLYGTRTPKDILYKKELQQWRGALDLEVHVTVDRGTGDWRGNVGVVTDLIKRAPFDPVHALAMVCGPEVMMYYTVQELTKRGVERENIYVSMERNMKCGIGLCGHCQWGPKFVCKDGPVFSYAEAEPLLNIREV